MFPADVPKQQGELFDRSVPFGAWMASQWRRPDPVGELVRAFYLEPDDSTPDQWRRRVSGQRTIRQGFPEALERAVREWEVETPLEAKGDTL